jgi:MerR family copper efflux transcriptional regulator
VNISHAAKRSGLSSETIRYYEKIELLSGVSRSANGYRDYSEDNVSLLSFIQHARSTGFSVNECRQLLQLYGDDQRQSGHVKHLVEEKLVAIKQQIKSLMDMQNTLQELAAGCSGNEQPHCHILDVLSESNQPKLRNENE